MYASEVADRKLTFVVSGMLWQRSLVMKDLVTESLWSHLLGQAMRGPLEGEQLEMIPSLMTDWKTWRSQHPDTSVLNMSRTARQFQRDIYRDPTQYVIGIVEYGQAKAWDFEELIRRTVVNDQVGDSPLLVLMIRESVTASIFDRRVDEQVLTFSNQQGKLVDDQTGTEWNPVTGEAISGPLQGEQLKPKIGLVSFRRAWQDFHPDSEYGPENR